MNLHTPNLKDRFSLIALYILLLAITFWIWFSLSMPTLWDATYIAHGKG
jgi:hypothetical protein